MIDLGNRRILDDGTVLCSEPAAVDVLYRGRDLSGVLLDSPDEVQRFNRANRFLDQGFEDLMGGSQQMYGQVDWSSAWMTPAPWSTMSVLDHCIDRCTDDEQRIRVCDEYKLFDDRGMIPVLRHLIWMVHDMRSRGVLWGVGRGSSVSSYMLYLIGINRIDPMRFGLDVREFLK